MDRWYYRLGIFGICTPLDSAFVGKRTHGTSTSIMNQENKFKNRNGMEIYKDKANETCCICHGQVVWLHCAVAEAEGAL